VSPAKKLKSVTAERVSILRVVDVFAYEIASLIQAALSPDTSVKKLLG